MKYLVTHLLEALLAATVLARPPPPHRDAGEHPADYLESRVANEVIAELPPGAYWEGDVLVLDPPEHVDKRSEAPPGPFGDIDATKWANWANLSTPSDKIYSADINAPEIGPSTAA
jgi:hypothetical protein